MTGRETKLRNILTRIEEIKNLELELRRILPRNRKRQKRSSNDLSLIRTNRSDDPSMKAEQNSKSINLENSRNEEERTKLRRSINGESVSVSAQTTKQREFEIFDAFQHRINKNAVEPFDILNYFRFPESLKAKSSNAFSQTSEFPKIHDSPLQKFDRTNKTTKIKNSVNASVQTSQKHSKDFETFDILDYFRFSSQPETKPTILFPKSTNTSLNSKYPRNHSNSSRLNRSPEEETSDLPDGNGHFEMPKLQEPSDITKKTINSMKYSKHRDNNVDPFAPPSIGEARIFRFFDRSRTAAASVLRTPAESGRLKQQVHETERRAGRRKEREAAKGNQAKSSRLEARSQRTRGNEQSDETIRVPVPKFRDSGMMKKWATSIGIRSGLASKLRDRERNQTEQSHEEKRPEGCRDSIKKGEQSDEMDQEKVKNLRMIKGLLSSVRVSFRLSRDVSDNKEKNRANELAREIDTNHADTTMLIGEKVDYSDERKTKRFRLNLFNCLNCTGTRCQRAKVVVPYHYPGDRTPRLVDTVSIIASDRMETLRVVSSAAKNFGDLEAEKAIMGSIVYCIHHKDGCKWSDELRKLKAHLNTCKHDAVPCSNKCGAMIPRVLMEDHLKYTCAQRRARCDFCAKEFTGHTLEKHTGTCGYEPLYCENKCGMKVQRRHLGQHKLGECAKRLVACRYCNKEFVFDTLGAHHAKCGRFPVACPHRCETAVLPREDLEVHLKDHCTTHLLSCTFKDAGCRFKGNRFSLDKHLEDSAKMHLSLMCSVVTKQQHQITSLKSAMSKLSLNYTGTLIWKINDYTVKMAEAKAKEGMELVSPPFYTSQYGYKLQASIFLNGNGTGEGSHLSIYIKILPGEYDALLRWPFSHSVSFTMFDQTVQAEKACNIVESFIPDPTWKNFQRPSREPDSLGFGFPRFVSHEMVKKRHFVKDDTMFIRVKVDPSKIVAV